MIDCKNNEDRIISYLENDLKPDEKIEFEKDLQADSTLKNECEEMKEMLKSLDMLPKVSVKNDFIISLNEKIDLYENDMKKSNNSIFGNLFSFDSVYSKISAVAISAICIFCIMIYSDMYSTNQGTSLSNSSTLDLDDDSVANVDSLNIDNTNNR